MTVSACRQFVWSWRVAERTPPRVATAAAAVSRVTHTASHPSVRAASRSVKEFLCFPYVLRRPTSRIRRTRCTFSFSARAQLSVSCTQLSICKRRALCHSPPPASTAEASPRNSHLQRVSNAGRAADALACCCFKASKRLPTHATSLAVRRRAHAAHPPPTRLEPYTYFLCAPPLSCNARSSAVLIGLSAFFWWCF